MHLHKGWFTLLLAAPIAFSQSAHGDVPTTDSATAQALFDQAKSLMAAQHYSEACPKLEESQRLDPGLGTLFHLADCYEHQGRIATGWSTFLEVAGSAKQAGQTERERLARQRASDLAPRLSKLLIAVSDGAVPGFEVRRDGAVVGKSQWGAPIPVDQGLHRISASAPGRVPWDANVMVKGGGDTVSVTLPHLESAESSTPAAPPLSPRREGPEPGESNGLGAQRSFALVAGGLGLVGVAVGSAFGFASKSKRDEATGVCDGPACFSQAGVDAKEEAITSGNLSTVFFVAGAAGVAAGAFLWFTATPSERPVRTAQVGIGPGAILLKGAW